MSEWAPRPTVVDKARWHVQHGEGLRVRLQLLRAWNRWTRRRVTSARGTADVSMTTYGPRVADVFLALETIGLGRRRPRRLVLWVDDERLVDNGPPELRRLQGRGLDVRLAEDDGPHKKWYPYATQLADERRPLVIADDDTLYPRSWLRGLERAYREHPEAVNCYRAHEKVYTLGGLAEYRQWLPCLSDEPSSDHFATGVSGVIYAPEMVEMLRREGDAFRTIAPRADDVWLHFAMLAFGWPTRQIGSAARVFPEVPGTRETGLHQENTIEGGNDAQIRATAAYFEGDH